MQPEERAVLIERLEAIDNAIADIETELASAKADRLVVVTALGEDPTRGPLVPPYDAPIVTSEPQQVNEPESLPMRPAEPGDPATAFLDAPRRTPPKRYRPTRVHPAVFGLDYLPHLVEKPRQTEAHLLAQRELELEIQSALCGEMHINTEWEEVQPDGVGPVEMCGTCIHVLHEEVGS